MLVAILVSHKTIDSVWVSFMNGISTFVNYLIPKLFMLKNRRNPVYPTPPFGQDMTQGKFFKRSLTGLNSE